MSKVKVLALRIMEEPKVEYMKRGLEPMQEFVGGWIQCVPIGDCVDLVCNEEGKFTCKPNRPIFEGQDVVYGDCFVSRVDPETGETVDLTDEDIETYSKMFQVLALQL